MIAPVNVDGKSCTIEMREIRVLDKIINKVRITA